MKSLQERMTYRAAQKQRESDSRAKSTNTPRQDAPFDAADWLTDTVTNVNSGLADLSATQLAEVEAAEKAGKNRSSVNDAVATEKKKREGAASAWGKNA